jgi:type I restriction enzyme S subunit
MELAMADMKQVLKPNTNWQSLQLFDRSGWKTVRLEEVCEEVSERVDKPAEAGYDRFIGLEHMDSGELMVRRWGSTVDLISSMKLFRKGDTLFARRNAYLRRASMVDFAGLCSGDAIVLREKKGKMASGFLPLILNSDRWWTYAIANAAGSMSKRVNVRSLLAYEFALPPLDQQRRIADLLSGVCEVDSANIAVIDSLVTTLANVRSKALVGELSKGSRTKTTLGELPSTWRIANLSDVLRIAAGNAFKSDDFAPAGIQLIRLSNLFGGVLDLSRSAVFLPVRYSERYPTFVVRPGDILFSMTGTVGKEDYAHSVVVPAGTPECLLNQRVAKLVPCPNVLPEYLLQYLWSRHFLDQIYSKAAGSKQANVSNKDIYSAYIPLPPLAEQSAIVSRLQELEIALLEARAVRGNIIALRESLLEVIC